MQLDEREVMEFKFELARIAVQQFGDDGVIEPTGRALIVPVLDESDRRVGRSSDSAASGWRDRQRIARTRQLRSVQSPRSPVGTYR